MSNYEEIHARHVALTQQIMNALRANRFIIDEQSGDDTWTGDELLLAPLTTDGHDPYKFAEILAENLIVMFGEKVFIGAYVPAPPTDRPKRFVAALRDFTEYQARKTDRLEIGDVLQIDGQYYEVVNKNGELKHYSPDAEL